MFFLQVATPPKPLPSLTWAGIDKLKPAVVQKLKGDVARGRRRVEVFFGGPFGKPIQVRILAHRADFDAILKEKWNAPASHMEWVSAGGADTLAILDPSVWKTEATEHNGDNEREVELQLTHDLVNVYHAQHNLGKDFVGMGDLAWFVEGLATYVSGQLTMYFGADARKAVAEGLAPHKLSEAGYGKYRYGVSGSMAEFVDRKFGRKETVKLLAFTKPDEVLGELKLTEQQFLDGWRAFLEKPKPWLKKPEKKEKPKVAPSSPGPQKPPT